MTAKPAPASSRSALTQAVTVRGAAAKARDDATAALADFQQALAKTRGRWVDAIEAFEKANRDLAEALRLYAGDEASTIADAIRDGRPLPRAAISNAKIALDQDAEAYRLGKEGLDELEARKNLAEQDFERAERHAMDAIYAIEREALPALIVEARKLQDDLIGKRAVIRHLSRSVEGMHLPFIESETSLRGDASRLLLDRRLSGSDGSADAAAVAPWLTARAALLANPDAALPLEG